LDVAGHRLRSGADDEIVAMNGAAEPDRDRGSSIDMRLLLWLCLALLSATLTFSAWSQQRTASARLALVIANADYANAIGSALPASTLADADALATELRHSGFEVELKKNLGSQEMRSAIDAFTNKISPDMSVLFYFSGFGAQVDRRSYLFPVNANPYKEEDVRKAGINVDSVLTEFHNKGAKVKILVLDAARRSPFERRFRPSAAGLAAVNAPENSLALYSSVPGKVIDRSNTNGVFVGELIKEIRRASNAASASNKTAEDVFNQLKIGVYDATGGEQIPWVSSSLVEEFYFSTQNVAPRPVQDHTTSVTKTKTKPTENVPLSYQSELDLVEGDHFRECAGCPEMVVVPSGNYMMGAPNDELDRTENEVPRHRVTIPQRFAVGTLVVTRDEFEKFVKETEYDPGDKCWTLEDNKAEDKTGRSFRNPGFDQDGTHPAVCVNWDDAKAYVAWLSNKTGKLYRLPSESEWEYVARAGTTTPFWWGSSISTSDANYNGNTTYGSDGSKGKYLKRTVPAETFKANPWGLYQVSGNAFEWVEDCWNDSYAHDEPSNDGVRMAENWAGRTESELHAGGCSRHVRRGGAWNNSAKFLRSAFREWKPPNYRASNMGLRVARTLNQSP
jgi:formylglycine-generating enzyme required for sulfatase activity